MLVRASAASILVAGCLAVAACQHEPDRLAASPIALPVEASSPEPIVNTASQPTPDLYVQAIDRAKSAALLSRSAQSKDDWQLVVGRWQQAIHLMATVPPSDPHRSQAKQKLGDYQRSLAFAQRQAGRSLAIANPDGVIVFAPRTSQTQPDRAAEASGSAQSSFTPSASQAASQTQPPVALGNGQRTFSVPIVRRAGNTPVVNVQFNDSQTFEMIVDTGASGTLITRSMADALGVVPVAQTKVDTASARDVKVPLGYVGSMNVGGATAQHVLVAIAGPELSLGLLGHDFFGNYDVTIRESRVEFQER
jgi:predicted aspartyl protease